jgi:hypothetical protein
VSAPELSVIIPVTYRYDDVEALYRAYRDAIAGLSRSAEIIYVLDGPQPTVLERFLDLRAAGEPLEIVQLARSFGEATALAAGKDVSRGALILTLPAYFQVEPSALRSLFDAKNDHHMVIAHRWPRRGSAFEALRRRLFHRIIAAVTGLRYRNRRTTSSAAVTRCATCSAGCSTYLRCSSSSNSRRSHCGSSARSAARCAHSAASICWCWSPNGCCSATPWQTARRYY